MKLLKGRNHLACIGLNGSICRLPGGLLKPGERYATVNAKNRIRRLKLRVSQTPPRESRELKKLRRQLRAYQRAQKTCRSFGRQCNHGKIYYLDAATGLDSNPGSSDLPWKTLAQAQSQAASGDTVIVREGFYGEYTEIFSEINRTDYITYKAEPGTPPHISGIWVDCYPRHCSTYLTFDGFTVGPSQRNSAIELRGGDFFKLLNSKVVGSGSASTGLYGWGAPTNISIDNCLFEAPSGRTGRFDGFGTVIALSGGLGKEEGRMLRNEGSRLSCTYNGMKQLNQKAIFLRISFIAGSAVSLPEPSTLYAKTFWA